MDKIVVPELDVIDLKSAYASIPMKDEWLEVLFYSIDNYNDLQIRVSFDQGLFKKFSSLTAFRLYIDILDNLHEQYEELHKKFLEAIWKWYFNYLKTELPVFIYKNDDGTELEILSVKDGYSYRPLIRKNEVFMARFANVVEIDFTKNFAPLQGYLLKPITKSLTGGFIKETYKGAKSREVRSITPLDLLSESYVALEREIEGVDD
jgi:hypothetical protein|nr:MAG TPA: hypothetical protein [Caudoviricetes sp.]